jgi:hypothetical protein
LNLLPWHGQMMAPSAILLTLHPAWGHTDESPVNVPAVGCVTTTSPTITPEPTGTCDTLVNAVAVEGGAADGAADVAADVFWP